MSKFGITLFKEAIAKAGGLSRANLFKISIDLPAATIGLLDNHGTKTPRSFLCKSVALPAEAVVVAPLYAYGGREISIPGTRNRPPFSATFWNSNDYQTRNLFVRWVSLLSSHSTNERGLVDVSSGPKRRDLSQPAGHTAYCATISIEHFESKTADPGWLQGIPVVGQFFDTGILKRVAIYTYLNAFPSSVSPLTFSMESDEFQSYDVQFHYEESHVTIPSDVTAPIGLTMFGGA